MKLIFIQTNFLEKAIPIKVKPMKIYTHKKLATVIVLSYSLLCKFNQQNKLTTKISTFNGLFCKMSQKDGHKECSKAYKIYFPSIICRIGLFGICYISRVLVLSL